MKVEPLMTTSTSGLSHSPSTRFQLVSLEECVQTLGDSVVALGLGNSSHHGTSDGIQRTNQASPRLETVVKSSTSTWTSRWSGRCQPIARRSQRCICKQDRLVLRDAFGGSVVGNSFSSYVWFLRQTAKLTDGRVVPCPTELQAIM